jgi:GT2 family glycosyltransferase
VSAKPLVSIIIPSAAAPALLRACLRSLEKNAPRAIPFETIVVLNGQADYTSVLRDSAIDAAVVSAPVNLGLAGAANRARDRASGQFLLILHDDSEVEPGWMEALVEAARRRPQAGAIGGMVLYPDGRVQGAGMILWRDATTSVPWPGPEPSPTVLDTPRPVDYIGTSSLLIRTATWDATGGFDEQFYPVYYVDVDFAMRVRRHGQSVWYEPRSRTRHHQGASGSLRWRHFVSGRNRERFLSKWAQDLQQYESRIDNSEDAINRALARAAAAAENPLPAEPAMLSAGALIDVNEQDARHRQMESCVQRDYSEYLSDALQHADDELGRLRAGTFDLRESLEHLREQHRALDAELDTTGARNTALQKTIDEAVERIGAAELHVAQLRDDNNGLQQALDEGARQRASLEKMISTLSGSDEELRRLQSLRWWRLYGTLQPILRLVSKIAPRRGH